MILLHFCLVAVSIFTFEPIRDSLIPFGWLSKSGITPHPPVVKRSKAYALDTFHPASEYVA